MSKEQQYVLLSVAHNVVLPMEEGIAAFAAITKGIAVEYQWSDMVYKRTDDRKSASLEPFTATDLAKLELASD